MRRSLILFTIFVSIVFAEQHAIIFGTADGYDNYCITSEPCRVYTYLTSRGIKSENIILMVYSSNLKAPENPYNGMIFTEPSETTDGDWAKHGCFDHIDYTNEEINPEVFLAILSGDAETVKQLTGKENPKVLAAGPEDTVFTYFIDHGSESFIRVGDDIVPNYALLEALETAHSKNLYGKWLWFMEACYSGSMFIDLPDHLNIFAVTAADDANPAVMDHCPPDDMIAGQSMNTCLGALFSNVYLDYMEEHPDCTIGELVEDVTHTVASTSFQNVSHWGDMSFKEMKFGAFVGYPTYSRPSPSTTTRTSVPLPEVPAHLAKWKAIRAENAEAMEEYQKVIFAEAKKEVEVMRLGSLLVGEKKTAEAAQTSVDKFSASCVRDLSLALEKKCGHSLPLANYAMNILRTVCKPGMKMPAVDFSAVCIE